MMTMRSRRRARRWSRRRRRRRRRLAPPIGLEGLNFSVVSLRGRWVVLSWCVHGGIESDERKK